MIYLVLAIISSFIIAVLIKLNELKGVNPEVVISCNYIVASILGWLFAFSSGIESISRSTVLLGLVGGIIWPATFYVLMWGIGKFGLSLTGSIARLSLVVPVSFALIFLGETLTPYSAIGIASAFVAFFLLNPPRFGDRSGMQKVALWFFPLLVLLYGMVETWVNVFNHYGVKDENFIFVVLIFTFSAISSWTTILLRKVKIKPDAIKRGLFLGIPNYFSTYLLLESLRSEFFRDNSSIAFSLYAICGVILAFSAGVVLWREKVSRLNIIGVLFAIIAIVLLNLKS